MCANANRGEGNVTRILVAGLLAAGCWIAPSAAMAQSCPDGKTATGQCVNPGLADAMRQAAVIYSQPKISFTHYPVLPAQDWIFRYPNQLNPDQARPAPIAPRAPGGGFIIF
jgi:hypothetical protein